MSITKDFATAKKTNPSIKFADFKSTWKSSTAPVSSTDYATAVKDATPSIKEINEASAAGVNPVTGTSNAGSSTPKPTAGKWVNGIFVKGTAPEPVKPTSKSGDGIPIWEELGMTRDEYIKKNLERSQTEHEKITGQTAPEGSVYDPYAALQGRQMEGGSGSVSPYIAEGKAKAIREGHMENVGDIPTDPASGEGYNEMTPEQKQQAQIDYKTSLADWYKRVGEEGQKELGDVSSQIQNFGNQMQQYEEAIASLTANISQANPELGSALNEVFAEISQDGGGNITPDILANIQTLAESGLAPADFKTQVSAMLTSSISPAALQAGGVTDTGDTFQMSNGISFPKGVNGLPDFDPANLDPSTNAYDIAAMELMTNNQLAEGALKTELQNLIDLSKSVARWTETSKSEVEQVFDTSSNKVDEQMLATMNNQKYQQMKLEIEKNNALGNILEQGAQMEGYMKGQLEAWGATESSAALSVMGNIKNKFLQQYTQTAQGYDLELSRVSDKITEAHMAYTNRSIEIANQKALSLEKINNNVLDNIDKVFSGTKSAYQNRDMKFLQNNTNYFKTILGLQSAEKEARAEAEKDTRDFNFKMMKEMADNKDLIYEVGEDGSIQLKLGADGRPISSKGGGSGSYSGGGYTSNSSESGGFRAYLEKNAPETLSMPVEGEFVTSEMGYFEQVQGRKKFNEAVDKFERFGHWASPDFNNPDEVAVFDQYSNVDNSLGRFGNNIVGVATSAFLSGKGVGIPKIQPLAEGEQATQKTAYTGDWKTDNKIRKLLAGENISRADMSERKTADAAEKYIYDNNLTVESATATVDIFDDTKTNGISASTALATLKNKDPSDKKLKAGLAEVEALLKGTADGRKLLQDNPNMVKDFYNTI